MQKHNIEELVREELRNQYLKEEESGEFRGELYADYRDEISEETAGEILEASDPEMEFYEKLGEWYDDAGWSAKTELIDSVKNVLEKTHELTEEDKDEIEEYIRDNVWFDAPAEHFLDQELCVNIMLDTGDGNYDFTLNSLYPCWYGREGEKYEDKASLIWLAKQQGYGKRELRKALEQGDMADPHGFLESCRVELANLPSHMSTVTFLVKMTFRQLLELHTAMKWRNAQGVKYDASMYPYCGYIVLDKSTMCGLYDSWAGGGSVLEIQLEKDVRVPIKYIWRAVPDGAKTYGYQVGDVYGMCRSAWKNTLKELHLPSKMREVG